MTSSDAIHPVLRKIKGEGSGFDTKFCQDLVMAGFYVTCKVFPEFTFVTLYVWRILRKVKFLRKNFPFDTDLPIQ